jgi:TatD DNase family protein
MYENLIDTHAHVLKEMYKEKRDDIIQLTKDKGVEVINVGINLETSIECVEIAKEHKNYYATIGVHPVDAEEVNDDVFPKLKKLYLENKDVVVGIGETGLDNKYVKDIEKQKDMFIKHIELAKELNLPIIIHNREAFEEVKPIIDKYKDVNFLMHS